MNFKIAILCINVVAVVTAHNNHHLRQHQQQHVTFRATEGDLRRLLEGEDEAPSRDLETLPVLLRGSERRFLSNTCDDKKCGKNEECKNEKCECKKGFEKDGKECVPPIIFNVFLDTEAYKDNRSDSCQKSLNEIDLNVLEKQLNKSKKGGHNRRRNLSKKNDVVTLIIKVGRQCTPEQIYKDAYAQAKGYGRAEGTKGSRD